MVELFLSISIMEGQILHECFTVTSNLYLKSNMINLEVSRSR